MKGNEKVIEYLNSALKHELTAVNQFWLHYRLLDDWGYQKLGATWRKESIEEMVHADHLIERIIFLEGHPNLQHMNPLRIGENVSEVFEADLKIEYEARALYKEAREACDESGDYVSMRLFERLMSDEEGHIDFIETQMDLYDQIGAQNYGALNAKPTDELE
ncbi:bacterioferritin [Phaeobacter sp. J2-8]|uniref:bacterioferritin n=1 Tax=Phaeobacter sp. J2-8 TaxID=2931394 RepID=UPI001FD349DE|nr:bacterioferritin [Phaeobacter sp. J2-8]MCJ7874698.1 bacterioferritin [Phaeobacter sp. J2-8]